MRQAHGSLRAGVTAETPGVVKPSPPDAVRQLTVVISDPLPMARCRHEKAESLNARPCGMIRTWCLVLGPRD